MYFITFTDDFSRYDWIYLLHKNLESLDSFKELKTTVELKFNAKIKCVHSNRGIEFYGRYDKNKQKSWTFC